MFKYTARKILTLVLLFFLFYACSSVPRFTSKKSIYSVDIPVGNDSNLSNYDKLPALEIQIGIASFYADKYNGRITFSGEVYDMNLISAAHPSYAMNTILRITNLDNNKTIITRVNDKMPERPDRIIDLSLGAAKELDFVKKGLVKVKIEVLGWGNEKK
jgi:rare lipoprotein A